jgi:hypothetical protein
MRSFKGFVIYLFFSLVMIFAVLEAGMRISGKWGDLPYKIQKGDFNFEWGWEMDGTYFAFPPLSHTKIACQEFCYAYDLNSLGVREREVDTLDTASIRLFIYGDSFVEGNGTAYDSSWVRKIEELLLADGKDASVYMTGVSSSDPYYAYTALKSKLLALHPTHFIATINDSDFDNYMIRGGFSRFRKGGITRYRNPPPIYLFYRYSHLARMFAHQYWGYNYYLIKDANDPVKKKEAADSLSQAMAVINDLCLENDIRFLAVIHPTPHPVCFGNDQTQSDVLSIDPATITYPAVQMFGPLREILTSENCYDYCWKIDSHFNGHGYGVFGELVYRSIQDQYPDFWQTP